MRRVIGLLIAFAALVVPAQALAVETVTFAGVAPDRYTANFSFAWSFSNTPVVNGAASGHASTLTFYDGFSHGNDHIIYLKDAAAIAASVTFAGTATAANLNAMTSVVQATSGLFGSETLLRAATWTVTLETFDSNGVRTAIGTSAPFTVYGYCEVGTYSASGWGPGCIFARAGYYVYNAGETTETPCEPGTFQPNTGSMSCIDSLPGTYIDHRSAVSGDACARGTYQPGFRQTSCIDAPANTYVDALGATAYTDCPAGTTSPPASTSASACVAPTSASDSAASAGTTRSPTCTVTRGQIVTAACVARQLGISIARPKRSRLSLAPRRQAACAVKRRTIRGVSAGSCSVILVVTAPAAMPKTYRATVTISA